jgi:hypothetical protein
MTVVERDELAQFLAGLHQTRLPCEDAYASAQIRETVAMNPQGHYALALRCILLEKELAAVRGQAQAASSGHSDHALASPLQFLGITLGDWSLNARAQPKPAAAAGAAGTAAIPFYMLLEEKGMRFLSNHPLKIWTFILFLTFLVVRFRE